MGVHSGATGRRSAVPLAGFFLTTVVLGVLLRYIVALIVDITDGGPVAWFLLVVASLGVVVCLVLDLHFGIRLYELATGRSVDTRRVRGGRRARR